VGLGLHGHPRRARGVVTLEPSSIGRPVVTVGGRGRYGGMLVANDVGCYTGRCMTGGKVVAIFYVMLIGAMGLGHGE
jgi:hypothetical protein